MLTRAHEAPRPRALAATPIRILASALAVSLTVVLAPPFTPPAHADSLSAPMKQMMSDLREAGKQNHGEGVKVAILSDGVEDVLAEHAHVQDEKDFVRLPHPKREWGTLIASVMFGGQGESSVVGDLVFPGLVRDAELLPVRVQPGDKERGTDDWFRGAAPDDAVSSGLHYAVDHGARVILVTESWLYSGSKAYAAIAYAQSKDALVIAPVDARMKGSPGAFGGTPGVLGVGDVDIDGDLSTKYSTASSALMVASYGDKFPGVGPDGSADWLFWGDGPALAFVASTAAMVRSAFPRLNAAQVTQAITSSARNPKGHYTTDLGFGYLNASGALDKASGLAKRPPLPEKAEQTVADDAHFAGRPPGRVRAVPITLPWFGGFGALAGAGVLMIGAAVWLIVRRRPVVEEEVAASPPVADEA